MSKKTKSALLTAALVALTFLAGAGPVQASIQFSVTGSTGDGPVDASASFSISGDVVTVILSNLEMAGTDGKYAFGQLVSGIEFNVSNAAGVGSLTSTNSAMIAYLGTMNASAPYYTSSAANNLSTWQASSTTDRGANVNLTTITSMQPINMIIGPDTAGGLSGSGTYDLTGSGNHEPMILGTGTFEITDPGVTSLSSISDVTFEFGTSPDTFLTGTEVFPPPPPASVPEPASIAVWGILGAAAAGAAMRKSSRGRPARRWTSANRAAIYQMIGGKPRA